ncbi:hypothetical protein Tco_0575479 [Tanacetum coccineum]
MYCSRCIIDRGENTTSYTRTRSSIHDQSTMLKCLYKDRTILRNSDCGTGSRSDNTVGSPHGFVIHGIEVFEGNEEVTEVIDVENWQIDSSRVLRWVVSLIEWNSSILRWVFEVDSEYV